jgi:hypothetical protein
MSPVAQDRTFHAFCAVRRGTCGIRTFRRSNPDSVRQFDCNKSRPARNFRASVRVYRRSWIGEMINDRFQNQKKLFGKHGEDPPLQLPVMIASDSVFHL